MSDGDASFHKLYAFVGRKHREAISAQRVIVRAVRRGVTEGLDRAAQRRDSALAEWSAADQMLLWHWDRASRLMPPVAAAWVTSVREELPR